MRPEALNFILCPHCAGELSLSKDASCPADDGHIMTGSLTCQSCASPFAIRNGVPILLPANLASVKLETASRFAEEWTRWSALRGYYEQEFFDWVAPPDCSGFRGPDCFRGRLRKRAPYCSRRFAWCNSDCVPGFGRERLCCRIACKFSDLRAISIAPPRGQQLQSERAVIGS